MKDISRQRVFIGKIKIYIYKINKLELKIN